MATRSKKMPYKEGDEVWVLGKVTHIAAHPTLPEITQITIEMPNGHRETMGLNDDKVKPFDHAFGNP